MENESILKTYLRQQRRKRLAGIGPSAQPQEQNEDHDSSPKSNVADSGQQPQPQAAVRFNPNGSLSREDFKKSVALQTQGSNQVVDAVKRSAQEVTGAIRLMTSGLEQTMLKHNNRLVKAIQQSGGGGGGGSIFDIFSRKDVPGGPAGGKAGGKWGKLATVGRVLGGAALAGGAGYVLGKAGANLLGADEATSDKVAAVTGVTGTVVGGVLSTQSGRAGAARVGQAVLRNPGTTGAVLAGGYAAYQGAQNLSTLTDSEADTTDRIRAGSHLALSGVGAFVGSRVAGAKGAMYGAAAGDALASAAESVGEYLNDKIRDTKIGQGIQTMIGTQIDLALSPFSEEARGRLKATFSDLDDWITGSAQSIVTTASTAAAEASKVMGAISAKGVEAGAAAVTLVRTGINSAQEFLSSIPSVGELGQKVTGVVSAAMASGYDSMASNLHGAASAITNSVSQSVDSLSAIMSTGVMNFQTWFSQFGNSLDDLSKKLGNEFDNLTSGAGQVARSILSGAEAGAAKLQQAAREGYANAQRPVAPSPSPSPSSPSTSEGGGDTLGSRNVLDATATKSGPTSVIKARKGAAPAVFPQSEPVTTLEKAAQVAKGVAGAVVSTAAAVPGAAAEVKRVAAPGVAEGSAKVAGAVKGGVGAVAEFFESSGRGVGTISTGKGDHGGVSYGKHQLATNNGSMAKFLKSKEGQPFAENFQGLTPGTKEFNDAYKALSSSKGDEFAAAQKSYIDRTHFQPMVQSVSKDTGIDLSKRSNALNEAMYSTSVQYGGSLGPSVVKAAWKGMSPDATDEQLITKLQDYKRDNVGTHFQSSSQNQRDSVYKRTGQEKDMLLDVLAREKGDSQPKSVEGKNKWMQMREATIAKAAAAKENKAEPTTVAGKVENTAPTKSSQPIQPVEKQEEKQKPAQDKPLGTATAVAQAPVSAQATDKSKRSPVAQDLYPEMYSKGPSSRESTSKATPTITNATQYQALPAGANKSPADSTPSLQAQARSSEVERLKEKSSLTQQVEIANLPEQEPVNQQPSIVSQQVHGKATPNLDEIPLIINDMGLVLLQMGHA